MPAYGSLDVEGIIRSFPRYQGPSLPDRVIDFLGTKTRTSYLGGLQGGQVEDYPLPMNFHATALEWAGALAAVVDARQELVALELGAGWAPWLVSVARAAQLRKIGKVRLVGVEGSKTHLAYMQDHFRDNDLNPDDHTLLAGVVGPRDGTAEFPVLANPAIDWGNAAVLAPTGQNRCVRRLRRVAGAGRRTLRGLMTARPAPAASTERLPCYSIDSLLRPFGVVDLVHVDIQGHEYEVLAAGRQALRQKVKRIVVGTHSRSIEQQLLDELSANGWLLEGEEACLFRQSKGGMALFRDGCQVWKNTRLATRS